MRLTDLFHLAEKYLYWELAAAAVIPCCLAVVPGTVMLACGNARTFQRNFLRQFVNKPAIFYIISSRSFTAGPFMLI